MIKARNTPIHDGNSFQLLLQSKRDHLWFPFKKEAQKAKGGKNMYEDSTAEKQLPTEGERATISQTGRSQAGARDVNIEFQEDAAAQHLRMC